MISKDSVTSDSCFLLTNLGNTNADLMPGEILRLGKGRLTVLSKLGRLVAGAGALAGRRLDRRHAESTPPRGERAGGGGDAAPWAGAPRAVRVHLAER
jgi:hypothetical protein